MNFDDYFSSIRDANVGFVLTHRSEGPWDYRYVPLRNGALQFGMHGGGSTSDGLMHPNMVAVLFKTGPSSHPVYFDGRLVGDADFCVLGPSSRFVSSSQGARNWMGTVLNASAVRAAVPTLSAIVGKNVVVPALPGEIASLAALGNRILNASDRAVPEVSPAQLERDLRHQVQQVLLRATTLSAARTIKRGSGMVPIVHAALDFARGSSEFEMRIDTLCDAIGVSERTLLRSFNRVLGMGPKRYFLSRRLNLVRSALRKAATEDRHVSDVMVDLGVFEFGRTAVAYRRLFGESPSDTIRHAKLSSAATATRNTPA